MCLTNILVSSVQKNCSIFSKPSQLVRCYPKPTQHSLSQASLPLMINCLMATDHCFGLYGLPYKK